MQQILRRSIPICHHRAEVLTQTHFTEGKRKIGRELAPRAEANALGDNMQFRAVSLCCQLLLHPTVRASGPSTLQFLCRQSNVLLWKTCIRLHSQMISAWIKHIFCSVGNISYLSKHLNNSHQNAQSTLQFYFDA